MRFFLFVTCHRSTEKERRNCQLAEPGRRVGSGREREQGGSLGQGRSTSDRLLFLVLGTAFITC